MPRSRSRRPKKVAASPAPSFAAAITAFQNREFDQAARICDRLLAANPDNGDILNLLGSIRASAGDIAAAIGFFSRGASANPGNAAIQANLGAALASAGRYDEAETHFGRALEQDPEDSATRANLARAQHALGHHRPAVENFTAAIAGDPDDIDVLVDAGRAAFDAGDLDLAELYLRKGIALAPQGLRATKELIRVLHATGRQEEALARIEAALALHAGDAELHVDRGLILSHLERYEDALASFDRGFDRDPDNADALFGRALVNLLLGRFGAGWEDYRARESMRSRFARTSLAATGEGLHRTPLPADLTGRAVLVVGDQGLGDELFFLRFIGRLKERGARVAYRPDPRLAPMLERASIVDEIRESEPAAGAYDFRIAVGDIPWLTEVGNDDPVPPSILLSALPGRVTAVHERLEAFGKGPYIGVTWRAGSAGKARLLSKEAPLGDLSAALARFDGSFVVMQRNPAEGEITAFARAVGRPVLDLSGLNSDLEDMLALCGMIDAYIAVSNTNVHLRAACGLPSIVMVPFTPEFRWMAAGDESPWFPGSPLCRQCPDGDWSAALVGLSRNLDQRLPALKAAS